MCNIPAVASTLGNSDNLSRRFERVAISVDYHRGLHL